MKIENSHILITGGTSGIGKTTAKHLSGLGAKVWITGRNQEKLDKVCSEIGVQGILFDIADIENIPLNSKEVLDEMSGRIDVLINNAGIGKFAELENTTPEMFMEVFNTNVFGLALFTKEIIPVMKTNSAGTIINIASTAALKGFGYGTVYSASKFAVRSMTQCWQAELRPHNIRVCLINPSEVTTAFNQEDRIEKPEEAKKLDAMDIAHSIESVITMKEKGFIPELTVWATNPF